MIHHRNRLCDEFLSLSSHSSSVRCRSGLSSRLDRTSPADVLVRDEAQGKPAAFDITVASPLTPSILAEAIMRVGAAAEATNKRKPMTKNVQS